jgi:hypothetical protein
MPARPAVNTSLSTMQIKDHKHLPAKFLTDRITSVREAEEDHLTQTTVVPEPVPFGYLYPEWEKMKAKIRMGDELRYWRTSIAEGLALIHNNRIVDFIGCNIPGDPFPLDSLGPPPPPINT